MTHYEEPTPELIAEYEEHGYYPKPEDFEPVRDYPAGHKWYGKLRCQAWNSAKGRQCMGLAMVSLGVNQRTGKMFDKCKTHGGRAARGIESGMLKHGRYSAHLPSRLISKYEQIVHDSEMMDMRSRVELLETRILEIVENLDERGSFQIFKELSEQWEVYDHNIKLSRGASKERQAEYGARAAQALNKIGALIYQGMDDGNKWKEISEMTESIRKLADTEQRQIKTAESAVMVDRVMVFAVAMASIFRDAVMAVSVLPMVERKALIGNVEQQVSSLLQQGAYPQVIEGEMVDVAGE